MVCITERMQKLAILYNRKPGTDNYVVQHVLSRNIYWMQVSGRIPLPPRYAFGIFYSRYWAYDDMGDMVSPVICMAILYNDNNMDVVVYISVWRSLLSGNSERL